MVICPTLGLQLAVYGYLGALVGKRTYLSSRIGTTTASLAHEGNIYTSML